MPKSPDSSQALAAFIARKTEIYTILVRLAALSADHFNRSPDAITWGDAASHGNYLQLLRQISDAAFHEGEHAA